MRKILSKWLSTILPLALGAVLIFYSYNQYTQEQIDTIKSFFVQADYTYIYVSLLISTIGVASRAYRWKFSLRQMGYESGFWNNFFAVSIGYLVNMSIPRSGELSRALVLKKYNDIPFDKSFGSIVAERIVDLIVLFLLVALAFLVQFDVVKAFVLDKIPLRKTLLILGIGSVLIITAMLFYFYSQLSFVLKIKQKVSGLKEGLLSVYHMEDKRAFLLHTGIIWGSYILMFYVTIFALEGTSNLSFGAVLTSFIVGSMAIAVTSSGFGTYPVLMAKILLVYQIDEPVGVAFGWIVWTAQVILLVATGAISFLLLPLFNRKK